MQPPELTIDPIIEEQAEPCQAIIDRIDRIDQTDVYVIDFMGCAVLCRTASAALDLVRLINEQK
jgi:hypothetical protein